MQNINWETITEEELHDKNINDLTKEDYAEIRQTSWYKAMSIPTLLECVRDIYQSIQAAYFRMKWDEEKKENPDIAILKTCTDKLNEFSNFFHNEKVMSIVNDYDKLNDYYKYLCEEYKPFKIEVTKSKK